MTEQRAPGEVVSAAATVDARKAVKLEESITISRTRTELYEIWHNFDQLAGYLDDLESVVPIGGGRSHWIVVIPGGRRVEWDAELVNDLPNDLIAWKTVGAPDVSHAGSVHFRDAPNGAEMRVVIDYEPPGHTLTHLLSAFTHIFGRSPQAKLRLEMERFKARVEGHR